MYYFKKGDGDDDSRVKEVLDYTAQHVSVADDLRPKVERSPRSKAARKKCNKGGGFRRRMLLERDAAVFQELSLRKQEEADGEHALKASTALERSTPVVLYLNQYAADVARILIELDAEDHGVTKTCQGEKLVAAGSNAFERGDKVAVETVNATITQHQAPHRAAFHHKRHVKLLWRPLSDGERS